MHQGFRKELWTKLVEVLTGANALALARPVRGVDIKTPKMATAFYELLNSLEAQTKILGAPLDLGPLALRERFGGSEAVSYTHLRAHETPEHLVCRLLLEKKKT